MEEDEWALYSKLYSGLLNHLPQPHLIVFLDATVDTIVYRIHDRGREYEQSIPRSYIELLHELNKSLVETHKHIPTIFIDCNTVDVVTSEHDKNQVVSMVQKAIGYPNYNAEPTYLT
jgi:deoxyguanosine kinase